MGEKYGVGLPHHCAENVMRDRRGSLVPQMARMKLKLKCLSSACFCVGKKSHGLREGQLLGALPVAQVRAGEGMLLSCGAMLWCWGWVVALGPSVVLRVVVCWQM